MMLDKTASSSIELEANTACILARRSSMVAGAEYKQEYWCLWCFRVVVVPSKL